MSIRTLFFLKARPALKLHGIGIAAILIGFFAVTAWGNTQDRELAEKFSPILILTENPTESGRKVIFPEPVEIMKATSVSNLKFYIQNILEQELVHDFYSNLTSPWRDHLNSIYQNNINNSINLAENKFAFLPVALRYVGRPPGLAQGTYFVFAYFDYPGNKETGDNSWYDYYYGRTNPPHSQAGSNFANTAYVHIFEEGGQVVIQYYYFYPFNDWQNNHEGDWPRVNVIVNSRNPNDAELAEIDYTFHGKGLTYDSIGGRTFNPRTHFAPAEGETHPVVYVGAGSHGGYPTGGNYPDPGGGLIGIGYDEDMTTDGLVLSTSVSDTKPNVARSYDLILLPEPDTTQANMGLSPEMSWLGTSALWGTPYVSSPGDGPISDFLRDFILRVIPIQPFVDIPSDLNEAALGPAYSGWNSSGTSGYSKSKVPYDEFQQFPIVQNVTWRDTIDLIGDIVVYPGATLTIDAGTVIRAHPNQDIHDMEDASRVDIVNHGTINANGSSDQRVVFRSDSATPSAGDWYGIRNYGTLDMKNCDIQHAVAGLKRQGTDTLVDVVVTNSENNTSPFTVASIDRKTEMQYKGITPIQVNASGGWDPYTYSLSGAPSSITISDSGLITGAPLQSGTFTLKVKVESHDSQRDSTSFQMSVSQGLNVAPISDVIAKIDQAITPIQVSVSGGSGTYGYSISGAPSGITINSSFGLITGTPTESGKFTISVHVQETPGGGIGGTAAPITGSRSFNMYVQGPLALSLISDVSATQNEAITDIQVEAKAGRPPYAYALSDAPSGISISESGGITGTPTQTGDFTITVTVTDADEKEDSTEFTMSVSAMSDSDPDPVSDPIPSLTLASISDVTVTQHYIITAIQASTSGGRTPYTYSLSGAPSGIRISATSGRITGRPTQTGDFTITVTVTDADEREASTTFDMSVSALSNPDPAPDPVPSLTIASISDVSATKGEAITAITASASGGRTPYTYSLSGAPSGISISSSGSITGTPTQSGTFTISVTVRDADSRTATESFTMTVNAPISALTIAEINDITVKISAVQTNSAITPIQVSASGGQTPYAYSLSSNPATGAGLSINSSSGQITGTPTQASTFTLTVTVTDKAKKTATESFSMAVSLICDFNGDGAVNLSDHSLFVAVFGLSAGDANFNAEMDLNGDGIINTADFLIFVSHFPNADQFF